MQRDRRSPAGPLEDELPVAVDTPGPLGEFLRARRALVDPQRSGLPTIGRRRTPGLRREEVALLAGVSTHYYIRLEQGRNVNPSPPVLEALARVLELDGEARAHLYGMVMGPPSRRPARPPRREGVRPELQRLLERWSGEAVVLVDRYQHVLYANALASALNPGFAVGRNVVQDALLDPRVRDAYADLEAVVCGAVSRLRASAGSDLTDPVLHRLVEELSATSPDFPRLWDRHEVQQRPHGTRRFTRPQGGPITVAFESFPVPGTEGHVLYVYFAGPSGADQDAFATMAAGLATRSSA